MSLIRNIFSNIKNVANDIINPATEEKQDNIITELQSIDSKDFATELTLTDIYTILNNAKDISQSIWVIEVEHKRIHQWQAFRASIYITIWNWNSVYCQFKTGNKIIHLKEKHLQDWTNILFCRFYENPTTIIDWTIQIPVFNANRNSLNTPTTIMYSNPTWLTLTDNIVNNATLLHTSYLPWTNQSTWPWVSSDIERVLKPNTNYLFQAFNSSAWTAPLNADFFWYEV